MIHEEQLKPYCSEDLSLIENYELAVNDKIQVWHCHHRMELNEDGSVRFTMSELKELGLYYNRPASDLILLSPSEHHHLHSRLHNNAMYGKTHSDEVKLKCGVNNIGKKHTEEWKRNHSKQLMNHSVSDDTRKKMSEARKLYWERCRKSKNLLF